MSVKLWKIEFDPNSQVDVKLNELLTMYVEAIQKYFSLSSDIQNFNQLFQELRSVETNLEQKLFKEWLFEKGKDFLENLSSKKFYDNENAVAKIDYQIYLLEDELDLQYPEDLIAELIGIEEELPSILEELNETAACTYEDYKEDNYSYNLKELLDYLGINSFEFGSQELLLNSSGSEWYYHNQIRSKEKGENLHLSYVNEEDFIYKPNVDEKSESPQYVADSFSVKCC